MSHQDAASDGRTSPDDNPPTKARSPVDVIDKSSTHGSKHSRSRATSHGPDQHQDSHSEVSRASQRHGDGRRGSTAALSGAGLSQHRPSVQHRRTSLTSSHRNEQNNPASAKIMYENTYQLQPVDEQRFKFGKVKPIVSQVMQSFLDGETYDARKCSQLSEQLSEIIRARVKELGLRRHKIVCVVTIGQIRGQTVRCASRCLWDSDTDGEATATFQNHSLFATATVYAIYYE